MLNNISVASVKTCEVSYEMSDRQAQRLAQTTRFALDGIRHRIQEYEYNLTEAQIENIEMERQFIKDYYQKNESVLYSEPVKALSDWITSLRSCGDLIGYGEAVREYRLK